MSLSWTSKRAAIYCVVSVVATVRLFNFPQWDGFWSARGDAPYAVISRLSSRLPDRPRMRRIGGHVRSAQQQRVGGSM